MYITISDTVLTSGEDLGAGWFNIQAALLLRSPGCVRKCGKQILCSSLEHPPSSRCTHLLLQNVDGALVAGQGGGLPRGQLIQRLLGADALALCGQVADRVFLLPHLGGQLLLREANWQPCFSTVQRTPACFGACTCQPQLLKLLLC